jgi:O-antigen/teichoic acid export membrane protein
MLGWLRPDLAEVAFYVNASTLSLVVVHLLSAVHTVTYPRVAALHARNELDRLRLLVTLYNDFLLLVIVPLCAILSMVAQPLITVIFGMAFRPSAGIFAVWILMVPALQSLGPRLHFLYTGYLQHHATIGLALGSLANVLLNLWLIPRYGVMGAVAATGLATALTVAYVSWIVYSRVLAVPYLNSGNAGVLLAVVLVMGARLVWDAPGMWLGLMLAVLGVGGWRMLRSLTNALGWEWKGSREFAH